MSTRIAVELLVQTVDPLGWDGAVWDTDVWETAIAWTDISCYGQGATIAGGRSGPLDRYRAQELQLRLDNRAGTFDAWSDNTPWAPPGVRHLGAGTGIRVGLDVDGYSRQYLFTGTVDTWRHRDDGPDAWVEIDAYDAMADFPLANNANLITAVGAGEYAGARIGRILGWAGIDVPVSFDTGVAPLQATLLDSDAGSMIDLTVDSDGGWLFVDGFGTLNFMQADRDQTYLRWLSPQATFGDDDTVAGNVCASEIDLDDERESVVNFASIAAVGGATMTAQDITSQSRYRVRTFERTDLIHQNDPHSAELANKIVTRLSPGGTRPSTVVVPVKSDADAWAIVSLRPHDRVRVVKHHNGDAFAADAYVDSWRHDIETTGRDRVVQWTASLALSPVAAYVVVGRWDGCNFDDANAALWGY